MSYYFQILLLSISIPIIFSFNKKIQFYKNFKILIKSIPLAMIPFIIWDVLFTHYKIWGFNNQHISNRYIINLPIEEILFFIVIPFCCLFTYHVIESQKILFFKKNIKWNKINLYISTLLILIALLDYTKLYTLVCFLACSIIIILENIYIKKIDYNFFYTAFLLLFIGFFLVNGALTGMFFNKTVVWYNDSANLGLRIITIPIEDLVYSLQLNLLNLIFYKKYYVNY